MTTFIFLSGIPFFGASGSMIGKFEGGREDF